VVSIVLESFIAIEVHYVQAASGYKTKLLHHNTKSDYIGLKISNFT